MAWITVAIKAASAIAGAVGSRKSRKSAEKQAAAQQQLAEKAAGANPWYNARNNFDTEGYLRANPDVRAAMEFRAADPDQPSAQWGADYTPYAHYRQFGQAEGRDAGQPPGWDPASPRTGAEGAGEALTSAIGMPFAPFDEDLENDPQYLLAQKAAAATSSTQPGGYSAMAASTAAMQTYGERRGQHQNLLALQNDRIRALSQPAGAGFNPVGGYQVAGNLQQNAAQLISQGQASGQYGVNQASQVAGAVLPWLQDWLKNRGLGNPDWNPEFPI